MPPLQKREEKNGINLLPDLGSVEQTALLAIPTARRARWTDPGSVAVAGPPLLGVIPSLPRRLFLPLHFSNPKLAPQFPTPVHLQQTRERLEIAGGGRKKSKCGNDHFKHPLEGIMCSSTWTSDGGFKSQTVLFSTFPMACQLTAAEWM